MMINKYWSIQLAGGLFAVFLLVYLHPYYGIRHDAVLYLGQALLRMDPPNFGTDLFFAFGSQADFTVFPYFLARLLDQFDAAILFQILTAAGLFSFLLASVALLARLFPSPHWYWGLLALVVMPAGYGGYGVFAYAEPFFTGRSLAEPLVLLAVAAYLGGKWPLAVSLWLMAAVLHPLQAAPALLIWWCERVHRDRRWLHLLWLPALALLAGALGAPYTDTWVTRYDAQWFGWIESPNRHVFITQWRLQDWASLTVDVFLVALVLNQATGTLENFARALLSATFTGFACSLILADIANLVFATGLQLWRVQWLLHWVAMASVPLLLYRNYATEGIRSVRGWLLLAAITVGMPTAVNGPSALAVWILIPLYFNWPRLEPKVSPMMRWLVLLAVSFALGIILIKHGVVTYARFDQSGGLREVLRPEFVLLAHPLVAGALIAILLRLYVLHDRWRGFLIVLLIPTLAHASGQWDRRSTWTRYIEFAKHDPKLFGFELGTGAQVFWAEELTAPWLILHRPSYYSSHQMAGMLFNRSTAQEAVKRNEAMALLNFQLSTCRLMNTLNQSEDSCLIDAGAITDACEKSSGSLDYLVLDNNLKKHVLGYWKIKGGMKGDRAITYYIYSCKDFVKN